MNKDSHGIDPSHHINIDNSIKNQITMFFNDLENLLDSSTMLHFLHQDAIQKDLKNTLEILEKESEKIGIKPKEIIESIDDYTKEKPMARGLAALTFNMNEMISFSPDFLDNITVQGFTKMMEERIIEGNHRIETIKLGFNELYKTNTTHIIHPQIIQQIQDIYNQCCKNMIQIEQEINNKINNTEKQLNILINQDIKRGWEMYRNYEEIENIVKEIYLERKITKNELIHIIEGVIMIFFFNKKHKVEKLYSRVLLEKVRNFIEERSGRNEDFYDDFKYLKQEYGYQILMYDTDYAIYEHTIVIKSEIEKLLEKNHLYILRSGIDTNKKNSKENYFPF